MSYEKIKYNYEKGFWNEAMVRMAVRKGIITQEQCDAIINGTAYDPEQKVIDSIIQEVSEYGY